MEPHPRGEQKQIKPNQDSTPSPKDPQNKKTDKKEKNPIKKTPNSPTVHNASDAS